MPKLSLSSSAADPSPTPPPAPTREPGNRTGAARARTRERTTEPPPCFKSPVLITRQLGSEVERGELSLAYCDGRISLAALDALSVLARSRHAQRPDTAELKAYQRLPLDRGPAERRRDPGYVTRGIMRLHPGLLERLQRVSEHFPRRAIEVVSGHRPEARESSRHHHGRALDFRVAGVTRERLRDFLRTFEQTGVGYYPNSSFVHMDVRDDRGYWVDRSGPGEKADYGVWPPPKREIERAQARIVEGALAQLSTLQGAGGAKLSVAPAPAPRGLDGSRVTRALAAFEAAGPRRTAPTESPVRGEPRESGDELTQKQIAAIRAEALRALADLQ
ncbi:MAG TPA: DUF882 domain-containing protein [Polyangiales bacterium]